jgi:uncharacterized protein YodC (DUF2158 family)
LVSPEVRLEGGEIVEPGDIVMLKSGSPPMTITQTLGDAAEVVWFETEVRAAKLPMNVLIPVKPTLNRVK